MTDDGFYTDEEIIEFARVQNCTVKSFKKRWIIMINGQHFVHGPHGYMSPIRLSDLSVSALRDLAPVPPSGKSEAGIDWEIPWGDGTKPKSMDAFLREYATVARKVVASFAIEHSYYDPSTMTFYERVCPQQALQPEYDENIDRWLRHLGGEILLDWIATITDLSRITCAIYLHAGTHYGKTLLASGLAQLWGAMPTEIESATGNFNSALLNCPLVFADEELPPGMTSGFIRKFVGSLSRSLKRKGQPESELIGAVRLIIAANNDSLLEFDEESFSPEDVSAIAARILYIKCHPDAAAFLKSIGGYAGTKEWVTGKKIAKHALWLKENRQVKTNERFLVEGAADIIHRRLISNGNIRSQVIEWVCRAMLSPWQENPGIRFGGGELFVNASFVQQTWEQVTGEARIPTLHKIGRAFKPLSVGEKRFPLGSRRADFYKLDVQHIYGNCQEMQIATAEDIAKMVNRPALVDDGGEGSGGGNVPTNGHANGHSNGHINGAGGSFLVGTGVPPSDASSLFDKLNK